MILLPSQLTSYNRLKDRSVKLHFTTQEIDDISDIDRLASYDTFGLLVFAEGEQGLNPEQLEEIEKSAKELDKDEELSPSVRLRNVLFVLWESRYKDKELPNGTKVSFNDFRRTKMEKLIQHFKNQIDD